MEIALEERNILDAVHYANCELSVTTRENAMPTLSLWRQFIEPDDTLNTMVMADASQFSALLRLRDNALSIMRSDKSFRNLTSFGPSFVGYALRFNGMPDDFAAFAGIKLFHEHLREGIKKEVTAREMKTKPLKQSIPKYETKSESSAHHVDFMQRRGASTLFRSSDFDESIMKDTDEISRAVVTKNRAAGDSKKGKRKGKKRRGKH